MLEFVEEGGGEFCREFAVSVSLLFTAPDGVLTDDWVLFLHVLSWCGCHWRLRSLLVSSLGKDDFC